MWGLLQAVIWHFKEYAWQYFWAALFAFIFLYNWLGRRYRRNVLRRLLGSSFSEGASFVTIGTGIAVDDTSGRFAVTRGRKEAICSSDAITELKMDAPTSASPAMQLTIDTTHPDVPRLYLMTFFRTTRLGDINAQLKAMHKPAAPIAVETLHKTADTNLEGAITNLTIAITALTEVLTERWPGHKLQ
jgi:hypothetical protein